MAKNIARKLNSWMTVAPPCVIYPLKASNAPELETIIEDINEEEADDTLHIDPNVVRYI